MRVTSKLRDVIYIQYIMTRKIQVSRKLRVGANLIPSFRGASAIHEWMPNENRTDDSFDNNRRHHSLLSISESNARRVDM